VVAEIEKDDKDSKQYAAQELEAALPDSKDREQISLVVAGIMDDVEKAGPDDASYEGIKGCIRDKLRVGSDVAAEPSNGEDR